MSFRIRIPFVLAAFAGGFAAAASAQAPTPQDPPKAESFQCFLSKLALACR